MRTFFKALGAVSVMFGLMAIAGSANDCDGHCMEQANTVGEMLAVIALGLICIGAGGLCIASASKE